MPPEQEVQPGIQVDAPGEEQHANVLTLEQAQRIIEDTPQPINQEPTRVEGAQVPDVIKTSEPVYSEKPEPDAPPDASQVEEQEEYTVEYSEGTKEVVSRSTFEYINRMHDTIAQLESENAAIEEFNKDPYAFYAKHTPHITLEKFDKTGYVTEKVSQKFDVRDEQGNIVQKFNPDPAKVYVPGTPDWEYRRYLEQVEKEADSYIAQATESLNGQSTQAAARIEQAKKSAMEKFGLDESTFNQKVWSKIEGMTQSDIISLLTENIVARDKIAATRQNIQTQIDRTKTPPGAASIIGSSHLPAPNREQAGFARLFGSKRVAAAYGQK